jgi:hypothetical protein
LLPADAAMVAAAPATSVTFAVAGSSPVALKVRVRAPTAPERLRFVKEALPSPFVVAVVVPPSVPSPLVMEAVTTTPA